MKTTLIDGVCWAKDDLAMVLAVLDPQKSPELWDCYYAGWRRLDVAERRRRAS